MKNLKKVLALVLAFACAFTMFAGAAFTDQADISSANTDAVDMLVALGVINGYTDGSFRPDGTVTRAEMAKMIYTIRSGGSTDASAYKSVSTTFTDVNGTWAEGYIKYCQTMGIIAGKSATSFDPDGKVTVAEAAKMALVTLGYKADKSKLTGSAWMVNTLNLANDNQLLDDVSGSVAAAASRQEAAQILFNMVEADCVVWSNDIEDYKKDGTYSSTGSLQSTLTAGEKYLKLSKTVGILSSVSKETEKDTYNLSVTDIDNDASSGKKLKDFTKVTEDYSSLLYQKVKVLYKDKDSVFGVYSLSSDNVVVSNLMKNVKMDGDKIKIDGVKYTLGSDTEVYVDGVKVTTGDTTIKAWVTTNAEGKNVGKAASVQAISNDDSNKINVLKVTTYETKKVTYVGKDYITAGTKLEEDEFNYPSDIKKNDYVAISDAKNYADDKGLAEKADVVEGKVTGTKGANKVEIGGTWYEADFKSADTIIDGWPQMGAYVKLVLVNGFVQIVDTISAGSQDVALVIETGSASGLGNSHVADVLFADGTRKTVDVSKDSAFGYSGSTTVTLVSYEVSKGEYEFTEIAKSTNQIGYDDVVTMSNATVDGKATDATDTLYFEGTGIVFVKYDTDKYKVVTGKDVANWSKRTNVDITALTETTSGNDYAQIAFVDLDDAKIPGGSNTTYAFALDDSYTQTVDGTKYTMVKAWNGTEEVLFKSEDIVTIKAREAFEYAESSDGTVDLTKLSAADGTNAKYAVTQVTKYDEGTGDIALKEAVLGKNKIDKDTVILYVDSDAKKGVEDGEIRVAENVDGSDSGSIEDNVIVYSEKDEDSIKLIVVDVNNEMKK